MYSEDWVNEIHVNECAVIARAREYETKLSNSWKKLESLLLLKVITLIDLATLGGDDTSSNVTAIINKALQPLPGSFVCKILNSTIKFLENIHSVNIQKSQNLEVEFGKLDEKKYTVKIVGNKSEILNGLSNDDVIEIKQLLKILHLNDNENISENMYKFLFVKNEIIEINAKNELKYIFQRRNYLRLCFYINENGMNMIRSAFRYRQNYLVDGLIGLNCVPYFIICNPNKEQIIPDSQLKFKTKRKCVRVAAICIYPKFVSYVDAVLKSKGLNLPANSKDVIVENTDEYPEKMIIASVAAGFPSAQYDLESKISEIKFAIQAGASEIDIVISRSLVLGHRWLELFNEINILKRTCGSIKMKTILGTGECGSLENVYKASLVAMMAGSNFIKTSTGKEAVNATFAVGLVMCRAIKNYYMKTGIKVGFKPSGGIRTADDSLKWLQMIVIELGTEWLPLFRIGASGLLSSIEQRLKEIN